MATDMTCSSGSPALWSALGVEHAAPDLVLFDRLKQRPEVALAEAVVTLPLNELEKDRADHGFGKYLQQDFRRPAFDHAFPIDQDAVLLHALYRFGVAMHAFE